MPHEQPPTDSCIVLNAFLRASPVLCIPCALFLALCGAGALISAYPLATIVFLGGCLCASYGLWLCWRLYTDKLLFTALAEKHIDEPQLDAGLTHFMATEVKARSMADRLNGTRRLYWRLLLCLPASLCCFGVGILAMLYLEHFNFEMR